MKGHRLTIGTRNANEEEDHRLDIVQLGHETVQRSSWPSLRLHRYLCEQDVRDILIQDGEYGTDEENKEDYAMWLPPENQSGDGVTKLNARLAGRY